MASAALRLKESFSLTDFRTASPATRGFHIGLRYLDEPSRPQPSPLYAVSRASVRGPLKRSNRGLASKVVRRIFCLSPQLFHIVAIGHHYFSTFEDAEDPFLPNAQWSRLLQQAHASTIDNNRDHGSLLHRVYSAYALVCFQHLILQLLALFGPHGVKSEVLSHTGEHFATNPHDPLMVGHSC